MKFLRVFETEQERQSVVSQLNYNTLSLADGVLLIREASGPGPGPEPVVPTDRIILKFMVTSDDWNEDVGKYRKVLINEDSGELAYDGGCFDYMIKDNERIDINFWSQYLYFDTIGEHTVELIFKEKFDGILPNKCLYEAEIYEAVISSNVTYIGDAAFEDCEHLVSVTIPNGLTSIGVHAFYNCSILTSAAIPNSVTVIGNNAFYGCSGLTSVIIPDGVTDINDWTFNGCTGLTSVTIGSGVTWIGDSAFYDCTGLTSLIIPDSVEGFGGTVFYGCNAINPPSIGDGVFYGTNDCPIYVPASSVDTYKAAEGWSGYASRIQAIQS